MTPFAHSPWPLVRLATVCAEKEWTTPAATPAVEFDYVDIASICNEKFEISSPKRLLGKDAPSRARKRIRQGDVLVATTRPYLRSIAHVPAELDEQVCSTGFCVVRAESRVISDWLYFAVLAGDFVDQLTSKMRGANYPAVTDADVLDSIIPLPQVSEQRRIVARIKDCIARVEQIEANAIAATPEIDALLPAILNERFAEIGANWRDRRLDDVADIRGGGSLPKGIEADPGDEGVLLVKVGDMNVPGNERVISTAREFLPHPDAGRGVVPAGAIIFPKRGGAIATNKKRLLGRPALIDPNLMAVVAHSDAVSSDYLYYWAQTLDLAALSNGGVIPQINRKDLAPLQLPAPGLEEQKRIVEELQRAEDYCAKLRTSFTESGAERAKLREAILRKAFAGEL